MRKGRSPSRSELGDEPLFHRGIASSGLVARKTPGHPDQVIDDLQFDGVPGLCSVGSPGSPRRQCRPEHGDAGVGQVGEVE